MVTIVTKIPAVSQEQWEKVNSFNKEIITEFLQQQQHLAPQTIDQYKSALYIFARYLHDFEQNKKIVELKPRNALKYQNWLIGLGLSTNAIKFKRAAVNSLCGYLEIYYEDVYPTFRKIFSKAIPSPAKSPIYEKIPLTKEEYEMLITELEKRSEWQQLAYVLVSYSSGARRAEVRQLKKEIATYEKLNGKSYYFSHEVRAKGRGRAGKPKKLQLDERSMNAVKKWLEARGNDDCPFLFVVKNSVETKQVGESCFNYWCGDIFTKIIGRRFNPHNFRVSRASHLCVDEGKNIKSAQKLLGHEQSSTTELYVIRNDDADLDDAFDEPQEA